MRARERRALIEKLVERSEAFGSLLQEEIEQIGLIGTAEYLSEMLAKAGQLDKGKTFVAVGTINRTIVHNGKKDALRCERCKECLSQSALHLQPATYSRADGSALVALVPVCSPECGTALTGG